MSLGAGNLLLASAGDEGYNLTRSLRFRSSATAWLGRTPASATNQTTWTWSGWVKRGVLASGSIQTLFNASVDANNFTELRFTDTSNGVFEFTYVVGGADTARLTTTQVFRDPSAYYHVIFVADTTQATAANRLKLYVNGAQVTAFSTATYPSLNANLYVNSANTHGIGITRAVGRYFDGYLTEVNFIDGQALTPSSFGSTNALTGVWQPARYTGTYGTNGFYLPFTDNSALTTSSNVGLGKDFSGNGNYWTTNNISITAGVTYDSMTDVPTLTSATAANFAVINPLDKDPSVTVAEGNLAHSTGASWLCSRGSFQIPTTGKWYWETTIGTTTSASVGASVGLCTAAAVLNNFNTTGQYAVQAAATGNIYVNGTNQASGLGTFAAGDIIQVAADCTNGKIWIGKNNVFWNSAGGTTGNPSGNTNETINVTPVGMFPFTATYQDTVRYNFGQRPFSYTPPTGFVALNTYNLPTSTIVKGNTVMDATTYTGNSSTQSIVNAAGFKPDLVWLKARSQAYSNALYDSVRGATKTLLSNTTDAEATETLSLTAFNSNGFALSTQPRINETPTTYVGWQWQAGQGSSSSNTNGTITSTVSVNASAGFSVITFNGTGAAATVGHGLGVAPAFYIAKYRSGSAPNIAGWACYHSALTSAAYRIDLNSTSAQISDTNAFNSTAPTSSVLSIGTNLSVSSTPMVVYAWTPIAGYSAFGSISANGAADNAFVYTGFLPRFVLFKRTDSTSNWIIWDTARNTFNVLGNELYPNLANAEASTVSLDIVSNGFKLRNSGFAGNWIYAAFASNPFKNSLAR